MLKKVRVGRLSGLRLENIFVFFCTKLLALILRRSGKMEDAAGTKINMQQDGERNFICGVIEGFYGRPWTTEQRKDLFRKLKSMGMDSYMYAPKDDYKHRAYWREMYTVEEADHLSSKHSKRNFFFF